MLREKKLTELYKFAIKYAHSFRNTMVEVDDLAQEMMLAVLQAPWKSDSYATRVMRNRFYDMVKRGKIERKYHAPFDSPEVQNKAVMEEDRWTERINAEQMIAALPAHLSQVLMQMIRGERRDVSQRTAYRYLKDARELVV